MKALVWEDGMGESYETVEIPPEMKADAETWRHELVDVVSQFDENVLEKYVGEEEITAEDLRSAVRAATLAATWSPSSTAPRSRTRVCSHSSTRSSTTCRARWTSTRSRAPA
jgi:translation elongation factor EF-G